jgi:hypothetical protein
MICTDEELLKTISVELDDSSGVYIVTVCTDSEEAGIGEVQIIC